MTRFKLHPGLIIVFSLSCATHAPLAQAQPAAPGTGPDACPAMLQKTFNRLQDEAPQNLCQFKGKVLLVVNTASYCGFTNQYEGLEALHARYSGRGFSVLGFPSNDFGQQEPGNSKEIADFCFNTYGVKFPMFSKSAVSGKSANPLFSDLTRASGTPPKWNFHKYLVDRKGVVLASFASQVEPGDPKVVEAIDKALASR